MGGRVLATWTGPLGGQQTTGGGEQPQYRRPATRPRPATVCRGEGINFKAMGSIPTWIGSVPAAPPPAGRHRGPGRGGRRGSGGGGRTVTVGGGPACGVEPTRPPPALGGRGVEVTKATARIV